MEELGEREALEGLRACISKGAVEDVGIHSFMWTFE